MSKTPHEDVSAELLTKLASAGAGGLKKTPLLGKGKGKAQTEKLAELESLVARQAVVRLGTAKTPVFVLSRFYQPLELARAAAAAKAIPGIAKLYTEKELGKSLAKPIQEKLAEAIGLLLRDKTLIRIQRAKSVYYLHTASLLPLLNAVTPEPASSPPPSPTPELSLEDGVRQAYTFLVRESGFSDVLIADLQRVSGLPLESLKPFLLAQSRAGRLAPSRGDWSFADAPARAAAIELHGEPYLRVRLI